MAGEKDGKTEKPTPKRLREARREGQFPRTPDASAWAAMGAAAAVLPMTGRRLVETFEKLVAELPQVAADPTPARALGVLEHLPTMVLLAIAPVGIAAFVAALLATAAQGVHPSSKALKFRGKRLNPLQGVKRMFGMSALWEAAKALLKVTVITLTLLLTGQHLVADLFGGGVAALGVTADHAWKGLSATLWAAVAAGVVLAAADYGVQRHRVTKQLMMSPRDIKDEHKQAEGDPMLKGAIRSRQVSMSRNRMLNAVSEADVVLVNPTHLAVALKYQVGHGAPRVVAKGAGAVAAKVRDRAREHRVPIVEDKPLARALYRVCEVGEEIPSELYLAVARILAFVMAAGRPGRNASTRRAPSGEPVPTVPTRSALRARRLREVRTAGR